MRSVGLAVDFQDDGAINDSIQECRREGRVTEVIAPGIEIDVGRQGGRALASAGVDDSSCPAATAPCSDARFPPASECSYGQRPFVRSDIAAVSSTTIASCQ